MAKRKAVGVRDGHSWTRSAVILGASLVVVASCSTDDGPPMGAPSVGDRPIGPAASDVEIRTYDSIPTSEPAGGLDDDPAPPRSDSAETPAPALSTSASEDGFKRAAVDGITFRYPEDLFVNVESMVSSDEPAVAVTLTGRDPGGGDATVVVRTVRDRSGDFLATAGSDDRDLVGRLESGPSGSDRLEFVNGAGVRRVDEEGYVFHGLTQDGVHLVLADAPMPAGLDDESTLAVLDAWVRSFFVDSAAEALQDDCGTAVSVLTEVQLTPTSAITPGEEISARWSTQNVGTCAWATGDGWVITGGDQVTLINVGSVAGVEPGEDHEVVMSFVAPADPGMYVLQVQFLPAGSFEPLEPIQTLSIEVSPR